MCIADKKKQKQKKMHMKYEASPKTKTEQTNHLTQIEIKTTIKHIIDV